MLLLTCVKLVVRKFFCAEIYLVYGEYLVRKEEQIPVWTVSDLFLERIVRLHEISTDLV